MNSSKSEITRQRLYESRREVLPGFPVDKPFESTEAVLNYLDSDEITCLCCGKQYRKLAGPHLQKVHGMTDDQYKEKYHIPYTYPLAGRATRDIHSQNVIASINDGSFRPTGNPIAVLLKPLRRKTFYKRELLASNMSKVTKFDRAKRPLVVGADGILETYSEHKKRTTAKKGSKEHTEKLKRPRAKKTLCRKGHPLTSDNRASDGRCLVCSRDREKLRQDRRKAAHSSEYAGERGKE